MGSKYLISRNRNTKEVFQGSSFKTTFANMCFVLCCELLALVIKMRLTNLLVITMFSWKQADIQKKQMQDKAKIFELMLSNQIFFNCRSNKI